jgi:hypothetical protein
MKKTTIWLSEADLELRDELAARFGTTASEIIRRAMYQFAASHLHRRKRPKTVSLRRRPPGRGAN